MALKRNHTLKTDIAILGIIWLIQAICDRIWLRLDSHIPAWDQTNHLTGSLNYLHALQNAEWFSGEWWRHLWMLSSKNPPLPYITSAPFQGIFGKGPDSALMMNFVFSAILLLSVYGLGRHLFNRQVGLWAAAFCVLFPRFYTIRIQYLIDYPLAALVTASFLCLTLWRDAIPKKQQWGWAIAFGLCLGGTIMIKQSVVFFLFFPLVWLGGKTLWKRDWGRFGQLCTGLLVSTVIFFPWYSTNWIFFIGSQQVVMSAASNEGDPPLNTLAAWTYYWKDLPRAVSFPLLIVPIVAFIFAVGRSLIPANSSEKSREKRQNPLHPSLAWLLLYFAGSYLLCSALFNKDLRYILPYLPVLSVILAYGFTLIPRRWSGVQWGTVGIAFLLMTLNLFPLGRTPGIFLTQLLSPQAQLYPYTGQPYPNSDVIAEVINTTPYLEANIGVLARLPEINHNNMNYYGALADFQVYGREIGTRHSFIEQDARSLDWFLTRQNTPESQREATEKMKAQIQQTPALNVQKTWDLPDGSLLTLYHRTPAPIQVTSYQTASPQVSLEQVIVPEKAPPGQPIPVTYQWAGPWEQLESGIVILTWHSVGENPNSAKNIWLHDHGIALGQLFHKSLEKQSQKTFQVIERLAMLPPPEIIPGNYTLAATYLNRETGESYSIPVPPITLEIDSNASATNAPELDLVTQMRQLAAKLPEGIEAFEKVFDEVGRINQYDPVQDYTEQAELALAYRLKQNPNNLDWAYGLAFANVLQEDAQDAIAALQNVVKLDPNNPFSHAYLAFVYLYNWQGKAAEKALEPALKIKPDILEFQAMSGVAALMQGHLIKAWETLSVLQQQL